MPRKTVRVTGGTALVLACILALGAIVGGAATIWWSSARRALAHDVESFVPAQATVLDARVDQQHSGGGRRGSRRTSFAPAVRYEFEVAGRRYESQSLAASLPSFRSQAAAEAFLTERGLSPGATVEAYHDADDPSRAVLSREVDPDLESSMWLITGVGALFAVVGLGMSLGIGLSPSYRARIMGTGS